MKNSIKTHIKDILVFILLFLVVMALLPVAAVLGFTLRYVALVGFPLVIVFVMAYPLLKKKLEHYNKNFVFINGFSLTKNVSLQTSHNWTRVMGRNRIRIGIDDFTQKLVGDIREVSLPCLNTPIKKGDDLITIKSLDKSLTLKSPVSGVVQSFNKNIFDRPDLMNTAPYSNGWIMDIRGKHKHQKQANTDFNAVKTWLEQEVQKLMQILNQQSQLAQVYQDGGIIDKNISKHIDETTWQEIKKNLY